MPTDCPTSKELADFHTGRLNDDRILAVAEHLDRCTACVNAAVFTELELHRRLSITRFDGEAGCRRARRKVLGITSSSPGVGTVIGDFRLLRELGRGGMGVVFEAEQRSLGRRVAVKLLNARGTADANLMRRFDREARAVGRLHHTNIVPVFGVAEHDGAPFYAMQLIRGVGLEAIIEALARFRRGEPERDRLEDHLSKPITARVAAGLIAQAADGIGHAHDQGVLHRDLKPSNLLLDAHGILWVTDFGLAKTDDAADLTQTGDLLGTVRYMAPEAFEGKADHRADVYALGLTLYELLALRPAFDGADRARVMRAVLDARPAPLGMVAPGLPRDLVTIVAKATDRDPDRRYQTARALADDLRRFVRDEPILARRVGPLEKLERWAKHNRGLAASLLGLGVVLVGVTVGSLLAAGRFRDIAGREGDARRLAQDAEETTRSNLYSAEMSLAARVADLPTGMGRIRELVSHWGPSSDGRPDLRGWEWRLFDAQCRQERFVRDDRLYSAVAWSPDGRRLAVQVAGGIELLDPADGATLARFGTPDGDANSLCWSADGRRLAVGHVLGVVTVLDAADGRTVYRTVHGTGLTTACFHPSGGLLATHSNDRHVRVHDLDSGRVLAVLPGASAESFAEFGFSPDGRRLATAQSAEGTNLPAVGLWNTADWQQLQTVAGLPGRITSIRWADNSRLLLPTFFTGVLVWDVDAGVEVQRLSSDRQIVPAIDVTADGRRAVAGDWGHQVRVWDVPSGKPLAVFRGHSVRLYRVAIAPDGARVATISNDAEEGSLRVWDVDGRRPVRNIDPPAPGAVPAVGGLSWYPDGRLLAAAAADGRTVLNDLTGLPPATRRGLRFTWDRNGRRAASQSGDDIFVSEAEGEPVRTFAIPGQYKCFDWNPKDDRLAVRVGIQLWIFDPTRPDPPALVYDPPDLGGRTPYYPTTAVAWHPAGRTVAFATPEADSWWVNLLDPAARVTLSRFPVTKFWVTAARWSPDGTRLAVTGSGKTIRVFDPATGELLQSLSGHTFTVNDLAYSPDGSRLATAGLDGNVILWDTASGRLILTFELGSPVLGVAWSADGSKLAALPETGVVKVWDAGGSK